MVAKMSEICATFDGQIYHCTHKEAKDQKECKLYLAVSLKDDRCLYHRNDLKRCDHHKVYKEVK